MTDRPDQSSSRLKQRGWTLVELLVAMVLGVLIIAGIGQIYLAAKRSYDIQISLSRLQEAGRYATEALIQDIRRAGYWGLMNMRTANTVQVTVPPAPAGSNVTYPTGLPATLATGSCPKGNADWGRTIIQRLFGLNNPSPSPGTYQCITNNLDQGDVLVVRYADPMPVSKFDAGRLYIRTAPYQASLTFGDPSLRPPGVTCTMHNCVTDPIAAGGQYDYKVEARAYYVGSSSTATECGKVGGAPLPALQRVELDSSGRPMRHELITGVEQLQFQYGEDTDGDGSVNIYRNADAVVQWPNVRAVRFWVLTRDDCPDPGYTDTTTYRMGDLPAFTPSGTDAHFHRALYSATVALRN